MAGVTFTMRTARTLPSGNVLVEASDGHGHVRQLVVPGPRPAQRLIRAAINTDVARRRVPPAVGGPPQAGDQRARRE